MWPAYQNYITITEKIKIARENIEKSMGLSDYSSVDKSLANFSTQK